MDIEKAVHTFLEQSDLKNQIVFITDKDIKELFGEEVTEAITRLQLLNRDKHLCSDCDGYCCSDIDCELYDVRYDLCPIYDFRPMVCRLQFCNRFYMQEVELINGLREVYFGSLMAIGDWESARTMAMSVPPFTDVLPEVAATFSRIVDKMQQGELEPELAAELLRQEVEWFRIN